MTHRYVPLNWIQWLTLALTAAVAIGFAWGFHEIGNVQAHQNDALRSIICRVQRAQLRSPVLTAEEKHRDVVFWAAALTDAHLSPCDQ